MTKDEQQEKVSELIGILKYTRKLTIELEDASLVDYKDVEHGPADIFLSDRIDTLDEIRKSIQKAISEAISLNEQQNIFFQANKNEDND